MSTWDFGWINQPKPKVLGPDPRQRPTPKVVRQRHKPCDYDLPEGSPIPGSRLVRGYCRLCGDRVRVQRERCSFVVCWECRGQRCTRGKEGGRRVVWKNELLDWGVKV